MTLWIGIDVAKATLAVHFHPDGQSLSLLNTPDDVARLLQKRAQARKHGRNHPEPAAFPSS